MWALHRSRKTSIMMSLETRTARFSAPFAKMSENPQDEFAAIFNTEVRKETTKVGADCRDGQPQLVGDLLVRPSAQKLLHDLCLPR